MKELNINGANIDLVSYAHQQDSGKRWGEGTGARQCCQFLANFSGQFGGKVRHLSKILCPLVIFPFRRHFAFRNKTIFVYVSRKSTV
jgi:hypothetical protein